MSEITDISSILQNSLLLTGFSQNDQENKLQTVQNRLDSMSTILDKDTLTKLKNGEYEISLKEYTDMNTYNTMMASLYGNNSANKFQNSVNLLTNSAEENLNSAKSFITSLRESGMSNQTAVKTYFALQKYSLMSSFGNYNYVNAKV
jgi:ABC-type metal ion transport system substrate-binding protein